MTKRRSREIDKMFMDKNCKEYEQLCGKVTIRQASEKELEKYRKMIKGVDRRIDNNGRSNDSAK